MLVESLVKKSVELQGFRVLTVTKANGLEAELAPDGRYTPRCSGCGRYRDTRAASRFRHVPPQGISEHLVYAPRRVICEHCGGIHAETRSWVSGKRQFTRALMVTLASRAQVLTWQQVAALFHGSWSTVAVALDEAVAYGPDHRDLSGVTRIGIDEISQTWACVCHQCVRSQEPTLVVECRGRAREALEGFLSTGKERAEQLEGVCCDMWQPCIDAIKTSASKAILVS